MFNLKIDYVLNKMDPRVIVYIDSEGKLIRLTLLDFTCPEEFQCWKEWSDNDYHKTNNADTLVSKRTVSMYTLSEKAVINQLPEDVFAKARELWERQELCRLLKEGISPCLTAIQRYPLCLYCFYGLIIWKKSPTKNRNVVKSIAVAEEKTEEVGRQNPIFRMEGVSKLFFKNFSKVEVSPQVYLLRLTAENIGKGART